MMHSQPQNDWPQSVITHEEAYAVVVKAMYDGFSDTCVDSNQTPQENATALALHYGDSLALQKPLIHKAYYKILYNPKFWPMQHAMNMADAWLQAIGLKTYTWRDNLRCLALIGLAHRLVQAWLHSENDDTWLQQLDTIMSESWVFIENSYI